MTELSIDELAYYVESPSVIIEIDRMDSTYYKRKSPKFINAMRVTKVNVATPQEGRHPYSYQMESILQSTCPEGTITQQIESCLANYPEGSKVHIRMAGAPLYVEHLYPHIRTVCRSMNRHGQYENFIELMFPRGGVYENKTKIFGSLKVDISSKRESLVAGTLLGRVRTHRAGFEFLDDDVLDSDIKKALGYLKLLGAEVAVENFSVGIDTNYNPKTLDYIRKIKRIMDAI